MASTFNAAWSTTAAYPTVGTRVTFNGVIYESRNAITAPVAPATTNPIPFDNDDWRAVSLIRIVDYYSLIEAVRFQLKQVEDDETNLSIPYLIQQAELEFQRTIRVQQMQRPVLLTADSNGLLEIPSDVLTPINLRYNIDVASDPGNLEIRYVNQDAREFQRVNIGQVSQFQRRSDESTASSGLNPVYRIVDRFIEVAPKPEAGTEFMFQYFGSFPDLGTVVGITDRLGRPVNSDNQTVTEWIASSTEANPRTADNFVQATEAITVNWFTANAPDLYLYGTLVQAALWLRNEQWGQYWKNQYDGILAQIDSMVEEFETSGPQEISLSNGGYPS